MSFVLCHDCYTWVMPQEDRCPECLLTMDLSAVDPPLRLLEDVLGHLVGRVGEVRVPRRLLPEWGMLYLTSQGLFFLPHEIDHQPALNPVPFDNSSVMWTIGSLFWSPLMLLRPLLHGPVKADSTVRVLRPRYLEADEKPRLAELLMDNPGSFFLPRQQIRGLKQKRNRWVIERNLGKHLQLYPGEAMKAVADNLAQMLGCREAVG